jgi:hypothetical protein
VRPRPNSGSRSGPAWNSRAVTGDCLVGFVVSVGWLMAALWYVLSMRVRSQGSGGRPSGGVRNLRSKPVIRMILTRDRLGETSRNGPARLLRVTGHAQQGAQAAGIAETQRGQVHHHRSAVAIDDRRQGEATHPHRSVAESGAGLGACYRWLRRPPNARFWLALGIWSPSSSCAGGQGRSSDLHTERLSLILAERNGGMWIAVWS